ncbi:uncharacterized protein N7477_000811 [Penicillium maclennaniae]|uniref:uncharacterized protein n=1 Tax=Penicillium maclennaniae TaxID=1343394 RepID=UPI00254055C7|nr:uncharacterized protein N7477_000811 [Penicillium maclennaniae]KAJ5684466.1 hypothetical protein N7477_000811 [Penicillium maclennaniae]
MEPSQQTSQMQTQGSETAKAPSLIIDFSWRKFKSLIYEGDTVSGTPRYALKYSILGHLKLVFKRVSSPAALNKITSDETGDIQDDDSDDHTTTSDIVGRGKIRNVRIDADYEVHGRSDKLVAQKRWHTEYTHRSQAMSNDGKLVTMYWLSDSDFKTWDFICVDENQLPVAKFTANIWALKKLGKIEFMGPKAHDRAFQEEIMVAGTTLAYCMIMRVNNPLSLLGSAFAKPGHDKDWSEEASTGANGKHAVV